MIINHNLPALNAYNWLTTNTNSLQKSLEKLSSGYRINRAGDDAAGLAISEKMRAQISGLDQAQRNAQDGISLIQTAEGALNETTSILQRMRELAVQAANGTYTTSDRAKISGEMQQLFNEINRIASQTQFNTMNLLGNNVKISFQVGANSGQTIQFSINKMVASVILGTKISGIKLTSIANSTNPFSNAIAKVIANINSGINTVSKERANMGAYQNRLEHTINNLQTSSENLTAAESRIRDVDMAKEMMNYTKQNILLQASQAMLAQANQLPQGVLQLLR
ncbi:flagellin [Kyrpidia sp.]|uniref:flagellin N-terminal helical domain-containing protein n=1 Tax=Kyrpidia sp. TaxID=2073077 RepID=UPI00258F49C7|nr:flagellin [Kyrpidia sp.]MCL6577737.1 flagellin [Kyrpidia sp.]